VQRLLAVLEQLQVPLAQVREQLGIPGMDTATARNFRDKARMKTVLRAPGRRAAAGLAGHPDRRRHGDRPPPGAGPGDGDGPALAAELHLIAG
jgi:hypothetical protein